jgi:TatD DNase family protein
VEWTEIGVNLGHRQFGGDRDAVLGRALAAGVTRLVVTGTSLQASREALALARARPGVLWCTAGVHPHNAREHVSDTVRQLRELLAQPEVVAVGECGLDYFRNFSARPAQVAAFRRQLDLAVHLRKPVFLHQRDAHDEFLAILREYGSRLAGGVAHCFTGSSAEASAYLDLGLYIGITGWICDERRGLHLREVVRTIPAERLVVETDGPYLLPRDLHPKPQSRRNEPMYLPHVLRAVAAARGQSPQELASLTTRNAHTLFGWPVPAAEA